MDPASVECGHCSLGSARIVVLDKTVIETFTLKLRLIDQLAEELVLSEKRSFVQKGGWMLNSADTLKNCIDRDKEWTRGR